VQSTIQHFQAPYATNIDINQLLTYLLTAVDWLLLLLLQMAIIIFVIIVVISLHCVSKEFTPFLFL